MRSIACVALLLLALPACGCLLTSDEICEEEQRTEPGDCGAARVACVQSCAFAGDYRRYVDARCEGGEQRCPPGTVRVTSCDDGS